MRKYIPRIFFISALVGVISFFIKSNQENVPAQDVYWNVLGAFLGMFAGMLIYYKYFHEEKDEGKDNE